MATVINMKDLGINIFKTTGQDAWFVSGTDQNDSVVLAYGNDTIYGGGGNDWLNADWGTNFVYGEAGNDTIAAWGSDGTELHGGADDDTYLIGGIWNQGKIVEKANEGIDTMRGEAFNNGTITIAENVENLVLTGVDYLLESGEEAPTVFNVTVQGNALSNSIQSTYSNDKIWAGAGHDTVRGGDGLDNIYGQDGNDHLFGEGGDDLLDGGKGDDFLDGGAGKSYLYGRTGNDTYVVRDADDKVTEYANEGTDTVLTDLAIFTLGDNLENLTYTGAGKFTGNGNTGANVITGGASHDYLAGNGGNDDLRGGAGNDSMHGGDDNDRASGGDGNDWITGGTGIDNLKGDAGNDTVEGGDGIDFAYGGEGNDKVYGGADADILYGDGGNDYVNGGTGADILRGGDGNDSLVGEADADLLEGGNGNDVMLGGDGKDTLRGGNGEDVLRGGIGSDQLAGGANADRFVWYSTGESAVLRDRVQDFQHGVDKLDLYMIDANTKVAGNDAFFLGGHDFTGKAGELITYGAVDATGAAVTILAGDVNGDKAADLMIEFTGNHAFTNADFFF
jgi:Ca2+-binding RTX toxin-like protein